MSYPGQSTRFHQNAGGNSQEDERLLRRRGGGGSSSSMGDCCGPCGECYESNKLCVWVCVGILLLITLILFACSFDVVKPTQYGILQNGWSGTVYMNDVYSPGRYFVWLRNFFITFPAYAVNVEFSVSSHANAPPVPARTGKDLNDPDSGGQPVTLSFSFQYQFNKDDVGKVYKEFGDQYEARYLLFARMAVSDVAQKYTRDKFATLQAMLKKNGRCEVTQFQLLQVDFPVKYEKMITDIQLRVQYKLTSEYQQKVTNVLKDIDVLTAETEASIASINAGAAAKSALLVNEAKTNGFYVQQSAKAESYAELKTMLSLTSQEVLDYVKVRSLTGQGRTSQTVVGTPQPSLVVN